ncbi:MAG: DUF748 domain-containing protein [Burkholderiaceae bacterium]|jgi:uncharacterized protein involved in outer membrane biogenesis|nr:DUF748 domain-containing protein [Burkholderiaceae bacterium]
MEVPKKLAALYQRALLVFHRFRRAILFGTCFLVVLIALCGAVGMWTLPDYIKSRAEAVVREKFGRQLVIRDLSVNPFTLSVTASGVTLSEPGSEKQFASIERIEVSASSASLFLLSPIIREVAVHRPFVHLIRTRSNHYNVDDFIALAMAPDPPDKKPFYFSLHNVRVEEGEILFDDTPANRQHKVEALRIELPYFSSRPSRVERYLEPHLSARVNGKKIELTGKTRPLAKDRESTIGIVLEQVDLREYMGYLPYKPAFHLEKGTVSANAEIHFVMGEDAAPRLDVSGTFFIENLLVTDMARKPLFSWKKLGVDVGRNNVLGRQWLLSRVEWVQPDVSVLTARDGRLNLASLMPPASKPAPAPQKTDAGALKVSVRSLTIKEGKVRVSDRAAARPYTLVLDPFNVQVGNAVVDMAEQMVRIDDIASQHTRLTLALEPANPAQPASSAASASRLSVHVGKANISDWSAHLRDNSQKNPPDIQIDGFSLRSHDLSNAPGKQSPFHLEAHINKGKVSAEGKVGMSPLSAEVALRVESVGARALQPYIDDLVNLSIRSARISTNGKLMLGTDKKGEVRGSYRGDFFLDNLATVDQVTGSPFFNADQFALKQMQVQFQPFFFAAERAELRRFFIRLILGSDERLNIQNILKKRSGGQVSLTGGDGEESQAAAPEKAAARDALPAADAGEGSDAPRAQEPPPPVRIGIIALSQGRVRFTDNFIRPRYTARLENVRGRIKQVGVSGQGESEPLERGADVKLFGQVNGAPLTVTGTLNLFNPSRSLDIRAKVRGMELAQFSAYSGKYVGYGIEKGKLSFDVHYTVEDGKLQAENRLVLDQLTFGEKVAGQPVTNLPVQFALNLLKDSDGVIDINLPVSGSLNDPDFSVGGIVARLIVNLVKKVITSPFSLISAMFGGGEELSWQDFAAGKSDIVSADKLRSLAKALKSRSALKLEITGRYDPEEDRRGLARVFIDRRMREMKRKDMEDSATPLANITISESEYPKWLEKVYKEADFKKKRNLLGFQKTLPVPEMKRKIEENYKPDESALTRLADRRATQVKSWLVGKGVPDEQLFILSSKPMSPSGARADFSLK